MSDPNILSSAWPIQGGHIEIKIVSEDPLPAVAWPEVAVLMSVCQSFATKLATFRYDAQDSADPAFEVESDPTVARRS